MVYPQLHFQKPKLWKIDAPTNLDSPFDLFGYVGNQGILTSTPMRPPAPRDHPGDIRKHKIHAANSGFNTNYTLARCIVINLTEDDETVREAKIKLKAHRSQPE